MVPNWGVGCVDVRDVALCHLSGLEKGSHMEKYICSSRKEIYMFPEIGQILKEKFGDKGYNPPTSKAPNCILSMMSICDSSLKFVIPGLDKEYIIDNIKSIEKLDMNYRDIADSLEEMVVYMIDIGFIPDKRPKEIEVRD